MRMHPLDFIVLQHATRHMDYLYTQCPRDYVQEAVEAFLALPKGTVFIYTGFYVAGFAETDGPPGAYMLAKALQRLGYTPHIITDLHCEGYFEGVMTHIIPLNANQALLDALFEAHMPLCHISIERCGPNPSGHYLNARGVDITEHTAPLDRLFVKGEACLRIGIGDGGNEIGMGYFASALQDKHYFLDYCAISCDRPIIASVSNWGAYSFIAGLQKALHVELLPTQDELETYMQQILAKGCVDGIKRECTLSVDGKPWEIECAILEQLKNYTKDVP